ncbi:response regulator [Carboxylicivirga mesophila]|uniref:histidine kinase n=1 Tax=Carboxylicivirga mesophila TaxID=1166478 RepID=A0ABS5K5S0_9BACT|nr:ATP-binding protein [Carboxylicivirga mesophila]MBS2209888.1 response regulator [Carboxylicivirga mesophila]
MGRVTGARLYRKLDVFIRRRLGPTNLRSGDGLLYWRERIFHYFSIGVLFIGLVVYLYLGLSFIKDAKFAYAIFSSFVFFSAVFATTVRSLPLKFRVSWILFLIYLIGVYSLLESNNSSLGYAFFISYALLSGILVGQKRAWMSVITIGITIAAIAMVLYSNILNVPFEASIPLKAYIKTSIIFLVIILVTLLPLVSLLNGLIFNLEKETRYRRLLRREHEDLTLAKRKAEESDHLKTSFLSNMSHEIRTPMNAILGFSNLLSHPDISTTEKEEFINLIRINGKNLLTLVEDIIDISKIDSGQLQIKNAPCKLHHVMMQVYESFLDDIKRRGLFNLKLYLKEGVSDENIRILTDEHRLKQILINLVGNAVKFTERGFIEFGYTQEDDQFLRFYVKDTGIGLPKGKENEIFDRFSKFNDDKERLYGGTGIGLSIVKHLVTLMGGEVWVESEPLVGTTFFFTLPYHRLAIPENFKEESKEPVREFNWEGKTFLVAEDEEDNFRYIEVALALSNASLIWARDGQEAVDVFKRIDGIDLVLMDIKMPLMDGYTATRQIKSLSKKVPVIAQTAYAMSEEKEKSREAGCDDYIAKPIGYDDLLSTINRFVPGNGH